MEERTMTLKQLMELISSQKGEFFITAQLGEEDGNHAEEAERDAGRESI